MISFKDHKYLNLRLGKILENSCITTLLYKNSDMGVSSCLMEVVVTKSLWGVGDSSSKTMVSLNISQIFPL